MDDDLSIRNATQDLLIAAGYSTATFAHARLFLDWPRRRDVACLVTDVRMPGMTGFELYAQLVASGEEVPTIVVTAHPGEVTPEQAREAGISCFLVKPFPPDELLECVRRAVAGARGPAPIP